MKNSSDHQDEPFLLTFADLVDLAKKNKRKIRLFASLFALFAFFYAATRPIEYESKATFKDKGKSQTSLSKSISDLFFLAAETSESDALIMMKSRMLIEMLVLETGMQMHIEKREVHFPLIPIQTIKNNLLAEYALLKNSPRPVIRKQPDDIKICSVTYLGETPLTFRLAVKTEKSYLLTDSSGNTVGEGAFDQLFSSEKFSFNLSKAVSNSLKGNIYAITLYPLGKIAEKLVKKFVIETDRIDKNLLKISYRHSDRHQTASHIQTFMKMYQNYIYAEHQRIATLQVNYLLNRQKEMSAQLEGVMQAYAKELSSDLSATGFPSSEKAMEFLAATQQNIKQKVLAIHLEIHRLEGTRKEASPGFEKFASSMLASNNYEVVNHLATEIRLLHQEADAINLALNKRNADERLKSQKLSPDEFQGINLKTAKDLYLHYSQELNQLESQRLQLKFIIDQIQDSNFEVSSLSTVLDDAISIEMIEKASNIALFLKDKENRSQKELDRLHADLEVQKGFLTGHLKQSVSLLDIREKLLKDKLQDLQSSTLSLIKEQISILENQIVEYINNHLEILKQEKILLEENLAELRAEMSKLPLKWTAEALVNQQMDLNRKMIEEVTKLVESKNIGSNLEKIQSTPIDLPLVPIHPRSPHLFLFTILGAFAGGFLAFAGVVSKSIVKGAVPSSRNISTAGFHVSGLLSREYSASFEKEPILDSDLQTLRRLLTFFEHNNSRSLLILTNQGPNYVWNLAGLIAKKGLKALILDLCFKNFEKTDLSKPEKNPEGLLQYLEDPSKMPDIQHKELYDLITSGGCSRFANELVNSARFKILLDELQKQYDWILAYSDASICSAEAEILLKIFPSASVTIMNETLDDLQTYFKHAKDPSKQISFIFH